MLVFLDSQSTDLASSQNPTCVNPPTNCVEIVTLKPGDGTRYPVAGDKVVVHYVGTLANGTKFDSSRDRGVPYTTQIGVGKVIRGWDEAFMQLSLGQRARLTISSDWAYGATGYPGAIPPNAQLIFDVELIAINENVCSAPPSKCIEITSISPGDGATFPTVGDEITVHYVGTFGSNGKQFDSSRARGKPFTTKIGVGAVIKGWDEGFPQLSLGQRARMTISSDWAYGPNGHPAAGIPPNAQLIFDVELLTIKRGPRQTSPRNGGGV